MRATRALLAPLLLVALAGCSAAIPPAATHDDVEAFLGRRVDTQWAAVGLPDEQRPAPRRIRFISNVEFAPVIAACSSTVKAGYLRVLPEDEAASLAYYVCEVRYPIDPSEFVVLSTAQLNYLYTYFARWTVPCLAARGYPVGNVPTRAEFLLLNGFWNPIRHDGSGVEVSSAEYARLDAVCGVEVLDDFPTG